MKEKKILICFFFKDAQKFSRINSGLISFRIIWTKIRETQEFKMSVMIQKDS